MKFTYETWCIARLREAQGNPDAGEAHCDGDEILCRMLRELGYDDLVDEYEKIKTPKVLASVDLWVAQACDGRTVKPNAVECDGPINFDAN